jgi:thiamine-monophosphate kinase
MDEPSFTEITELGEFGLIDYLTQNITIQNASTIKGVGDDCAVIDTNGYQTVVSVDMLVENVHFDRMYTPLKHLGYKAITSSISDIYAMNAIAEQVIVSIAVSNQISVEMLSEIYSGMLTACKLYNVDLVGGDTTTLPTGMVINITSIGKAKPEDIIYRNTARDKDLICVTGDLGSAYVGLLVLEREKKVFLESTGVQPALEGYDYVLKRQLTPEARIDIPPIFRDLGIKPTSMIDISDGLSSEIIHICKQSDLGCKLFEEKIPIDPTTYQFAREFNLDPTMCALNGGEDYELLFTLPVADYEKIRNHPDFTAIGHITDVPGDYRLITKSQNEHPLKAQGWKVFDK